MHTWDDCARVLRTGSDMGRKRPQAPAQDEPSDEDEATDEEPDGEDSAGSDSECEEDDGHVPGKGKQWRDSSSPGCEACTSQDAS